MMHNKVQLGRGLIATLDCNKLDGSLETKGQGVMFLDTPFEKEDPPTTLALYMLTSLRLVVFLCVLIMLDVSSSITLKKSSVIFVVHLIIHGTPYRVNLAFNFCIQI